MGRRKLILISAVAACFIFASEVALAQGPRRSPRHGSQSGLGSRQQNNFRNSAGRERFYRLSPEERQAFQRNAERWLQMNPEQQKILREREQIRRQRMKVEAEAAMRQSGLRLDGSARDQWEARYLQERRRIERALRQEYEAKRQQQLPQLNERLKSEFQSTPGTQGNPGASAPAKKRDQ